MYKLIKHKKIVSLIASCILSLSAVSTKIVNARDADLLGTFPEALSDSLEDSEEIENGSSSPIQSPKNSTQTLDNVVVTPSLL